MDDTLETTDVEQQVAVEAQVQGRRAALLQSALLWDSLSYFGSKVVPGLMGLVSVPVFIRLIGLDQYGQFAVLVPLLMAVAGAASGWLAQGVLRFHPVATEAPARQTSFDQAVTRGTIASVLVTSGALVAVLAGLSYPLITSLIATAFCSSLLIYTVVLANFQAQLRAASVLRREIIRSIGGLVVPVVTVAITGRKQFAPVVLGQAIAYTVAFLPGFRFRSPANEIAADVFGKPRPDSSAASEMVRQLWRFGWAVGMWLLLSQMLPVIDRWVIQRFVSYTSAGVYASLHEIAVRSFSFLVFPLTQAAHPRIMRSWNEGAFATSYRVIRYSILSQFAIFVAVFGAVSVSAHWITRLILGFDDPTATRILPVLVLGGFLWQLALLFHKPLEIAQRTGAMLAAMAAVVVLNVIACFLFIPRFGYQTAGYILAFSACFYILFILCITSFRAFRGYSPPPTTAEDL
jgi:O-antigen/teichoic acid export membrane protein